jgi:hypothetical protein
MGGVCGMYRRQEMCMKNCGGETWRERPLGRQKRKCENNIKVNLQELWCVWLRIGTVGGRLWIAASSSMEQSPSWEVDRSSASQIFPRILWEPEGFITAFTRARHPSLSRARSIQSMRPPSPDHPTSRRFILILPSHLWALVNAVMNLRFPQNAGIFWLGEDVLAS